MTSATVKGGRWGAGVTSSTTLVGDSTLLLPAKDKINTMKKYALVKVLLYTCDLLDYFELFRTASKFVFYFKPFT